MKLKIGTVEKHKTFELDDNCEISCFKGTDGCWRLYVEYPLAKNLGIPREALPSGEIRHFNLDKILKLSG